MTSRCPPSASGSDLSSNERKSIRTACSARPNSDAIWSSSPLWVPTQRCSIRWQMRASSRRSGGSASDSANNARQSDTASAAEDDRPLPWGTSPVIASRAPPTGSPAACSSATAPRTNARQPSVGPGPTHGRPTAGHPPTIIGELESVFLTEVERLRLDPRLADRCAGDTNAEGDRERQRQAVVVVGVLADQVDPSGSECEHSPGQVWRWATGTVKLE